MSKFWNWFKSFIGNRDFGDAVKSVADDLKVASGALFGLGLLSLVPKLPAELLPLVAALGATGLQVSAWVTWLLFAVAAVLYAMQLWLRVTRKAVSPAKRRNSPSAKKGPKNGDPRGRLAADGRRNDTRNPAVSLASAFKRLTDDIFR